MISFRVNEGEFVRFDQNRSVFNERFDPLR